MIEKEAEAKEVAQHKADIAEIKKTIAEIKETSEENVKLFLEHERAVVSHIDDVNDTMQKTVSEEIEKVNQKLDAHKAAADKTDQVMLRDRLDGGLRYFAQRADEDGTVYVTETEYANMDALFQEYFGKNGNGVFEKAYESEFKKYKINRVVVMS